MAAVTDPRGGGGHNYQARPSPHRLVWQPSLIWQPSLTWQPSLIWPPSLIWQLVWFGHGEPRVVNLEVAPFGEYALRPVSDPYFHANQYTP